MATVSLNTTSVPPYTNPAGDEDGVPNDTMTSAGNSSVSVDIFIGLHVRAGLFHA